MLRGFILAALLLCSTLSASFQTKKEALRGSKAKVYVKVENIVFMSGSIVIFAGSYFFETRCLYSDKKGYYVYLYDLEILG